MHLTLRIKWLHTIASRLLVLAPITTISPVCTTAHRLQHLQLFLQ